MHSKEEFQSGLDTHTFGKKIYVYDSIDSTNGCAKVLANTGAGEGTVVIAEHQTAGRGRQGRTWHSQTGCNLLFSVILRPELEINKVGLLPFFAATGIALAMEKLTGIKCECKWPNDVLLNGKKCCGILMESSFQHNSLDYAIAGIGLNINQEIFPDELKTKATSLKIECKKEFDRKDVFRQTMKSLEFIYKDVHSGNFTAIMKEWKSHTAMFGKKIKLILANQEVNGLAADLSGDGGLILKTSEGQHVFYSGDVVLVKTDY